MEPEIDVLIQGTLTNPGTEVGRSHKDSNKHFATEGTLHGAAWIKPIS